MTTDNPSTAPTDDAISKLIERTRDAYQRYRDVVDRPYATNADRQIAYIASGVPALAELATLAPQLADRLEAAAALLTEAVPLVEGFETEAGEDGSDQATAWLRKYREYRHGG